MFDGMTTKGKIIISTATLATAWVAAFFAGRMLGEGVTEALFEEE